MYSQLFVLFIFTLLFTSGLGHLSSSTTNNTPEDLCTRITSLGYPCERHHIITDDGFILGAFRIPHTGRYPIFLQHGLLDSAITWIMNYFPNQNLATILYDAGFDIWLGNSRGNIYSRSHITLSPDETAFWDAVDVDTMAAYDLPANIEYVANVTGHNKMIWIGHSQGTFQTFAAFSDPYPINAQRTKAAAEKLDLFIALAPVAFCGHQTSVIVSALLKVHVDSIVSMFGNRAFLSTNNFLHLLSDVCALRFNYCSNQLLMLTGGGNVKNLNSTQFPTLTEYDPGGTSVHNMVHWAQEGRSGNFQKHDYGFFGNFERYGQISAPKYLLEMYSGPPVALFSGLRDDLADPEDVNILRAALDKKHIVEDVTMLDYGHMDFVWGLDAKDKVYVTILNLLQKYASKGHTSEKI